MIIRLNGLVVKVSDCNQETHVWLDDGTSVIRTLFSKNILLRKESESIDIGTSLTVFGKVELFVENEIVLRCGGFKIEEDCTAEIYHWLKILQNRPPKELQTKTVMFSSLSSYPSPNKIVTNEEFVESPIRDLDSQNTGYLWSPNHIFATSTPLRLNQQIISSPLNNKVHNGNLKPTNNIIQQDDPLNDDFHAVFDDDDDFDDFGEIDLVALEANAMKQIESSNKKRKCHRNPLAHIVTDINVLNCNPTDLYSYLLGMFTKLNINETLKISQSQLLDFLIDVQHTYQNTPYHSFYHAVDIVIVLYYMIFDLEANKYLTNMDISLLLIAAICHDAGHAGYNNDYHVKLNTELATRYHHTSVLESLSVDITLELFRKHHLQFSSRQIDSIRKLILSTDMTFHYDLLMEVTALEDALSCVQEGEEEKKDKDEEDLTVTPSETQQNDHHHLSSFSYDNDITTTEFIRNTMRYSTTTHYLSLNDTQRLSFSRILLHAADISNTVRTWPISKQWSDLIVQEFFRQGDAEKAAQLEVSPGMDRDIVTQPGISIKFGDFVVRPYFEAFTGLLPKATIFLNHLEENRKEWLKLLKSSSISSTTTSITAYLPYPVSVPAGTVMLTERPYDCTLKAIPIIRATSQSNILITPQNSVSSELRRKSADHIISKKTAFL
ncbi:uncharacterized protein BX663DRAFT_555311 [Cokeromyces recurvatus]|uniref:uncharacterized protein n=1 Tax=Cokeromyces recurvatus TaxID=90255 RepID=UPI0022206421|nr:uncharacterized protein BX663DRAFT_555311 [Cokeromyces recurvatus]KAI7898980.1 hypothetical protein BX663DRAFT_555311 [Cokeromyces recurvatus]